MALKNKSFLAIFLISIFSLSAAKRVPQVSIVFNPDDLRSIVREMISSHLSQQGRTNDSQIQDQLRNLNTTLAQSTELLEEFRGRLETRKASTECRNVQRQLVENPSSDLASAGNRTLRQMINDLDGQIKSVGREVENLESSLDGRFPGISGEGGVAEESTALHPLGTTERPRSAEEYLSGLQPVKKGITFGGSTIQAISAAVPTSLTLTVQIVNYLETPLEDYKLYLPWGEEFNEAPQTVPAKTQEVFTFKSEDGIDLWMYPWGVFSYKLAGPNFDLHLFFYSGLSKQIATAFLPRNSEVDTIFHVSPPWLEKPVGWSYESIDDDDVDDGGVKTTTIHKDGIHAKVTLQSEYAAKVKVEIFRF